MTTAYVHGVVHEDATFEQFVWRCAAAFDFISGNRDSGNVTVEAEIDDAFERERLDEAQTEHDAFVALDEAARTNHVRTLWERHRDLLLKAKEIFAADCTKLDAMAQKVRDWTPPSVAPLPELKEFMLQQLQISRPSPFSIPEVGDVTEARVAQHLQNLERDLTRARERLDAVRISHARRSAWVAALLVAVPKPEGR